MTPEGRAKVEAVTDLIGAHLREIGQYFDEDMQLTFLARMPGSPKGYMLVTTPGADLSAAIETLTTELRKEMQ